MDFRLHLADLRNRDLVVENEEILGETEGLNAVLALEFGILGSLGEEVLKCLIQVHQRLLQYLEWASSQPSIFWLSL